MIEVADIRTPESIATAEAKCNSLQRLVVPRRPYYTDSHCVIYHGDCRDVMPQLEDVELVLTDPPYGLGFPYISYDDTESNLDNLVATALPLMREKAKRVAISTGITHIQKYPRCKWAMACVWNTTGSYGKMGVSQWFPLLIYGDDLPGFGAINGMIKGDVLLENGGGSVGFQRSADEKEHTCPKPLGLMKKAIVRLSMEQNMILDPFCGSGTMLLAAKETNRRAIGIELEERYCEIAANRLAQGVML